MLDRKRAFREKKTGKVVDAKLVTGHVLPECEDRFLPDIGSLPNLTDWEAGWKSVDGEFTPDGVNPEDPPSGRPPMFPRIEVFMKNEWVIRAEGVKAQSLIDNSGCVLDPRAELTSATATVGPDGEIIEITPGEEIVEIFSGLNSPERVAPPKASLNVVPARIILGRE